MRFTCQRNSILNEIANSAEFTSQKSNLSITANVYLETRNDKLIIKATDQKMGFSSEIAVSTEEEGHVSVKCERFLNILRSLPEEIIHFYDKDCQMMITNDDNTISFNLRTTQDDFPELLQVDEAFFRIPKKIFGKLIDQTAFAVSQDETKAYMNGTLFSKEDNCLIMVGTDGKRLSFINQPVDFEIPDFDDVTIPRKFINIIKSFNNNEGDYDIHIDQSIMMIRSSNCEYYTVLQNTPFPNYRKVIPTNMSNHCRIKIKDMDEALKRVSLLVDSKFKRVVMQIENEKILISTEESDIGTAKETIQCEFDGNPFICALNYLYLQAPLKVMDGEYFNIWFNDPTKAFVIKPDPEREYLHVIMPMQVN
ncbi:MAG: DNA polymerase III subunit beta [Sphaerochaetaceae bacterium]|jgi:DNA polymerase III subunit beta|nr:DNA polymerase III subunit beta [Sphaerochaetaceae bacterium]